MAIKHSPGCKCCGICIDRIDYLRIDGVAQESSERYERISSTVMRRREVPLKAFLFEVAFLFPQLITRANTYTAKVQFRDSVGDVLYEIVVSYVNATEVEDCAIVATLGSTEVVLARPIAVDGDTTKVDFEQAFQIVEILVRDYAIEIGSGFFAGPYDQYTGQRVPTTITDTSDVDTIDFVDIEVQIASVGELAIREPGLENTTCPDGTCADLEPYTHQFWTLSAIRLAVAIDPVNDPIATPKDYLRKTYTGCQSTIQNLNVHPMFGTHDAAWSMFSIPTGAIDFTIDSSNVIFNNQNWLAARWVEPATIPYSPDVPANPANETVVSGEVNTNETRFGCPYTLQTTVSEYSETESQIDVTVTLDLVLGQNAFSGVLAGDSESIGRFELDNLNRWKASISGWEDSDRWGKEQFAENLQAFLNAGGSYQSWRGTFGNVSVLVPDFPDTPEGETEMLAYWGLDPESGYSPHPNLKASYTGEIDFRVFESSYEPTQDWWENDFPIIAAAEIPHVVSSVGYESRQKASWIAKKIHEHGTECVVPFIEDWGISDPLRFQIFTYRPWVVTPRPPIIRMTLTYQKIVTKWDGASGVQFDFSYSDLQNQNATCLNFSEYIFFDSVTSLEITGSAAVGIVNAWFAETFPHWHAMSTKLSLNGFDQQSASSLLENLPFERLYAPRFYTATGETNLDSLNESLAWNGATQTMQFDSKFLNGVDSYWPALLQFSLVTSDEP